MSNRHFKGFAHPADELSAYIFSIDTFIISLKNEEIVRFVTDAPEDFQHWLDDNGIRNVNETLGKMVYNYYFPQAKEKGKKKK
ncbi:MAG: hypothetical protein K8F30_02370 [Taibaiella sp.]|nr:hypothetical protein [Taibaiella sp.]